MSDIEKAVKAIESVQRSLVVHPMDMSSDRRMAWIYGILVGWGDALPEVAQKHGWTPKDVQTILGHRRAIVELKTTS